MLWSGWARFHTAETLDGKLSFDPASSLYYWSYLILWNIKPSSSNILINQYLSIPVLNARTLETRLPDEFSDCNAVPMLVKNSISSAHQKFIQDTRISSSDSDARIRSLVQRVEPFQATVNQSLASSSSAGQQGQRKQIGTGIP